MNSEEWQGTVLRFLSGGLGAVAPDSAGDGAQPPQGTTASPTTRPETTAPEPQLQDREPFLMGVSQTQILVGTGVLLGVIGLLAFVRR